MTILDYSHIEKVKKESIYSPHISTCRGITFITALGRGDGAYDGDIDLEGDMLGGDVGEETKFKST